MTPLRRLLRLAWRPLRALLLGIAAVVLFLEEWGWRPLMRWAARLAKWPPLARLEARITALPPRGALALFVVPAVALFPVKVLALWLIHRGHALTGVVAIILAKLFGTALLGRLFVLTEPQLMQFAWFATGLAWWRRTKERVKAALHAWPAWRQLRIVVRRSRDWARRAFR